MVNKKQIHRFRVKTVNVQDPAKIGRYHNVVLLLVHRLWCRPNIKTPLNQRPVFAGVLIG